LGEASPEQLGDLIAELAPADRDAAVANFLDSSLGKQRGPSDELVAVLAACGTAADSVGGKLEERLLHLVPEAPGDWAPGWGRVFALLPEGKREKVGLALGHRLLSGGAPWSIWSEWAPLLADLGTDERGEPLLGASLPERQALEQLPMSIVPLRFEGKPCLGVVIGRQEEVSVLTQPVEVSRRSASVSEADWQAATGNTPDEAWVGATCSFDVGNATAKEQRGTTCFLLRFPAAGQLARACPVRLADTAEGTVYDARQPVVKQDAPLPSPQAWTLVPVAASRAATEVGGTAFGGACFAPDGDLVAVHGYRSFLPLSQLRDILQVHLVPQRTAPDRDLSAGSIAVSFVVFDAKGMLREAIAMVRESSSDPVCKQAGERFLETPGEPAVIDGEEIPLTVEAGLAHLRIPVAEDRGTPFLVQIRCSLTDGSSRYGMPLVVSSAGSRPAGTQDWLVGEERRQVLSASLSGAPIPLHHTVDGQHARFGCVTATSLALTPTDLIADATGDHIYVGDTAGIRRIKLEGFQETVGILAQGESVLLSGSAVGLVAVFQAGKEAQLRILDPLTLAERKRFSPPFAPKCIAGSWSSPVVVLAGDDRVFVLDMAAGKVLQQLKTSSMLEPPKGARYRRPDGLRDIRMTPQGDMVCVLGSQSLSRFRLSPTSGLDALQNGDVVQWDRSTDSVLGMDQDGSLALVGESVYSLRQQAVAPVLKTPSHTPLAVAQGNRWAVALTAVPRSRVSYSVLDHRGVPLERWEASETVLRTPNRGLALAGGRRGLVWNAREAYLIELTEDTSAGGAGE